MSLESLKAALPDYAKDLRLNLVPLHRGFDRLPRLLRCTNVK